MESRSCAWRVLDQVEWPVTLQPCENHVMKDEVERGAVCADPGTDDRVPPGVAAARAVFVGRVDVDAADNLASASAEHGVGEPAALGEVLRVALEIAEVIRLGHLVRPASPGEPRRSQDVVDTGGPGSIARGVVLRPERLQAEIPGREAIRHREIDGNERLGHSSGDVIAGHAHQQEPAPRAAQPAGLATRPRAWPCAIPRSPIGA
jgi:hypothetical protein